MKSFQDFIFLQKWKYISKELLHIILKYDGKIAYRSGVYVNQIPRNEKRDKLMNKIPIKKYKTLSSHYSTPEFQRNVTPNGSQRLASGEPRLCTFLQIQENLQANVELSKKKWLFLRIMEDNELYYYYMYLYKGSYYQEVHKIE